MDGQEQIQSLIKLYRWNIDNGLNTSDKLLEAWKQDKNIIPIYDKLLEALGLTRKPAIESEDLKPTSYPAKEKEAPQKPVTSVSADFNTLSKYISAGIKLIPTKLNTEGTSFYQLKKDKGTPQEQIIKVDSTKDLAYWLNHDVNRFIFIPKEAGLLCLDIDRGHADGVDGVKNFYSWLKSNGLDSIPIFKDLDAGSFPVYATTPSGGIHLYFRCRTDLKTVSVLTKNVEVKYGGLNLTAGGSMKNGKLYSLHGEFREAPFLPSPMIQRLSIKLTVSEKAEATKKRSWTNYPTKGKGYTTDQLLDFARQDSNGGKHDIVFHMAKRLKYAGYTLDQVIEIIKNTPEHQERNDKEDTEPCIKSVYR